MVVADLTYYKPNVFFELGIRHCVQKPVIHLLKVGEEVPFDIEESKAIFLDRDYEKVISVQTEIKERIEAIQKAPEQFHSQVQQHIQLKQLKLFEKSQKGKDKLMVAALTTLLGSARLQTEMISNLHKELVEKPKQWPEYGQAGYGLLGYLSAQSPLQQALLQALKETKKSELLKSATETEPIPGADEQKE